MKKIVSGLIALTFIFLSAKLFSQKKEDFNASLSAGHAKVKEHARLISSGELKTKEDKLKHTEEAKKIMEETKIIFDNMKKAIPQDHTEVAKPFLMAIETYHTAAIQHVNALREELKFVSPDENKVKEHAKKLHESISNAEKQHQSLKDKIKK